MKIKFYGVRGSIPAPGPTTIKYGGNTSCVHIHFNNGNDVILDAGTGIRSLGYDLVGSDSEIFLMLSHNHWDHIQGYPFFEPIYQPDRQINVFTAERSGDKTLCSLFDQMDGNNFPLKLEDLPSRNVVASEGLSKVMAEKNVLAWRKPLNHPGGGYAYKFSEDGVTCAYVTDNELEPPHSIHTTYDEWVEFLSGVDVLIHDAQYTEEDMPHKHGWGHSLVSQVRQLAVDAEVGALIMFHHDPNRSDGELDEIRRENEIYFKGKRAPMKSFCAYESLEIELHKPLINGDTRLRVV